MSYECTFADIINRSPMNHSTAKMMYSFPKTKRFNENYEKNKSKQFLFNLPEVKNFRSTSIGYGKKSDFTKIDDTRKVPFYNFKSDFDTKKSFSPSYTFGISRHFYDKVILPKRGFLDKDNPCPGRYNTTCSFGEDAIKYSINPLKNERKIVNLEEYPGPGKYESVEINKLGKYPISSLKNTVGIVWGNSKEKRFKNPRFINPGPGEYSSRPLIDGTGSTFYSHFKSSTSKTITGRYRNIANKNPTPGPGAYMTYTEFGGLYDYNKIVEKKSKTFFDSKKTTVDTYGNNPQYFTTGFKNDLNDYQKITNGERKKTYSIDKIGLDENIKHSDEFLNIKDFVENIDNNMLQKENNELLKDFESSRIRDSNRSIRNQDHSNNLEKFKILSKESDSKIRSLKNNESDRISKKYSEKMSFKDSHHSKIMENNNKSNIENNYSSSRKNMSYSKNENSHFSKFSQKSKKSQNERYDDNEMEQDNHSKNSRFFVNEDENKKNSNFCEDMRNSNVNEQDDDNNFENQMS